MKARYGFVAWVRQGWKSLALVSILWAVQSFSQTVDTLNPVASSTVYSLALQSDGSLLAAGNFTTFAAGAFQSVGRLNPNGTSDSMFNRATTPALANNPIYCVAVQPDGRLLVGGGFTNLTGVARSRLTRLTADGRLDITFNASANTNVHAIVVQPDGKILVAGAFTNLSGQARTYLGRLESDGAVDAGFSPQIDGPVYTIALEADGSVLLGGDFATVNGTPRAHVARLDTNGNLDGFDPGADASVFCLTVQADGQILAGGNFTIFGGQPRLGLARVASNGLLDAGFDPSVSGTVRALAIQADGRIVAGGLFNTVGGQNRTNLVRLDAAGVVDNFNPGPNGAVFCLALQADGKLVLGGDFTSVAGVGRLRFARLNNDIAATQSLTIVGSTITWLRGGSSPEVGRATFEVRTNGVDWLDLPLPERINGGWQLTGVFFLANPTIRARGAITGGFNSGSTWFIESSTGPAAISVQPEDQIVSSSGIARFSITAAGSAPVSCQWYRNGVLIGGATSTWYNRPIAANDAGSTYDVVVSNALGTARSRVATLFVPGADSLDGDLANTVYGLTPQPDGSIVTGGGISILRFNPDGGLDYSFTPAINASVNCLHTLPDGKMLAGGAFTSVAGLTRNRLARFNADGRVDATFNPNASGPVNSMVVQPDGKIIVGGSFLTVRGVPHTNVCRLNLDGTPDATFTAAANGTVFALALQPDGKILVGGSFSTMNGTGRFGIARLNDNGSLDTTFNPGVIGTGIYCLLPQPDGKIVVGGSFTTLAGQSRQNIGRLNTNGTLDTTFNPGVNGPIQSLILQADGRILVSGTFSTLGGQNRANLGRLNPDGTLDTTLSPSSSGAIYSLALQGDGKIVAGGSFTSLWGASRSRLGRLNNTTAATQSLTTDSGAITWMRGGSCPEILQASFDYTTNSVDWIALPTPQRIAGGWQTVGATVPANATLRARGQVAAGFQGGSGYFVETSTGPTAISIQPRGKPAAQGEYVRVSVTMAGPGPFTYQWYRDGVALTAATNSWFLAPVLPSINTYEVVIVGPGGTLRSQPAYVWLYGTDLTFNPGADGTVYTLAVQPDQKILVGGAFTNSPGIGLARINPTGSTRDSNFVASATGGVVTALAVQRDGKILVGGSFTNLAGAPRSGLGRLNEDGSLDTNFNPIVSGVSGSIVRCLAIQPDGRILVGGNFFSLAGQSRYCLGRLNEDGSLDTGFNPPTGAVPLFEAGVTSLIVQSDGSIIACGELREAIPNWTTYVERLNSDGSLSARLIYVTSPSPAVHYVECAARQADGSVLVGGYFDWFDNNSQLHRNLLRLDVNGQVDTTFTAGADMPVSALAIQADGKIFVGGVFTSLAGQARRSVGRLNADGSLDSAYDVQATGSAWVYALGIQPDGRVLVGGSFTNLAGRTRNNIGRLTNLEIGASSVQLDGADVTWLRGNTTPEVEPTFLESSSDGVNWSSLGNGTRIPGGWQWNGVSFPANALLRTRGFIGGNNSFWFVENYLATSPLAPPTILTSAGSLGFYTNNFGLHVSGSFGHLAVLEASTNLVNWTFLQTNRIYNGPAFFSDSTWTNFPRRFYRVRSQ